ncbi:MAG: response regulator transcription factor [Candidatus Acidiferrales bacterium]
MAASSTQFDGLLSESQSPKVTVLIADESRMGCQLLENALSRSRFRFDVTACAVNRSEIISSLKDNHVDVALISQSLEDGPLGGFQFLSDIRESFPSTRAVVLLKTASCDLVVDAFRGGAKGVFCRTESFETLCKCIQSVHRGQVWANSDQLHFLLEAVVQASPLRALDYAGRPLLTKREDEVASLLAEGLSNRGVSQKLGISEHTVSNYLFRIYNKLGVSSRVELVLYLMRQRQKS